MEFSADLIDDRLWLGSIESINQNLALKHLNITHVLSILEIEVQLTDKSIVHKQIFIKDKPDEDLLVVFDSCYEYIEQGLQANPDNNILIHCQAGVSRSASIVCMWLMSRYKLPMSNALTLLKEARHQVSPNEGFRAQLQIFEEMNYRFDGNHRLYKEFLCESLRESYVDFDVEHEGVDRKNELRQEFCQALKEIEKFPREHHLEYRCLKCQTILFTDADLLKHPSGIGLWNWFRKLKDEFTDRNENKNLCTRKYETNYLDWLVEQINKLNNSNGAPIECRNCRSEIGIFHLQGAKCVCGRWVVPSIVFDEEKIEEQESTKEENIS